MILLLFVLLSPVAGRADFEAAQEYRFRPATLQEIRDFANAVKRDRAEAEKQLAAKYPDDPEKMAKQPVMVSFHLIESTATEPGA